MFFVMMLIFGQATVVAGKQNTKQTEPRNQIQARGEEKADMGQKPEDSGQSDGPGGTETQKQLQERNPEDKS